MNATPELDAVGENTVKGGLTPDIGARSRAALEGISAGPWMFQPWGEQNQNGDYAESILFDGDGETMTYGLADRDGEFMAAARTLVPELIAEVERVRRAAKTLGKSLVDSLTDVKNATASDDLIGEDGDGDWMLVFERLAELRPARDAALAQLVKFRAAVAEIQALHGYVRDICDEYVCGNCGGNPCETGEILERHGIVK